jgi:carboxymethylenebutenolidase
MRAAALALVLALCAPAAAQDRDGYTDAMSREHAGDAPLASPAVRAVAAAPIEEESVIYGGLAGRPLRGFLAWPTGNPAAPGVIVIHEWWGLNDNIRSMARQLAAAGYSALAVDLYGGEVARDPDGARALMRSALADPDAARANLRQAHAHLREVRKAPRTGSIGWCFGGGWSLEAALALGGELDGAVIYYGRVVTDQQRLAGLRAPLLGHFGELDRGIPLEGVREFEAALKELGKPAEIWVYKGAHHAFANPSGTRYDAAAAEQAWARTLAFFEQNLKRAR